MDKYTKALIMFFRTIIGIFCILVGVSLIGISFWISTFSLTLVLVFENLGILHAQVNVMLDMPDKASKALKAVFAPCSYF